MQKIRTNKINNSKIKMAVILLTIFLSAITLDKINFNNVDSDNKSTVNSDSTLNIKKINLFELNRSNAISYSVEELELLKSNSYDFIDYNEDNQISWQDFSTLCSLEEEYRFENPMATSEELIGFLEIELQKLIQSSNDNFTTMGYESGQWEIFGISLTTQEIFLATQFPVQAVIAFNASRDSMTKGAELYHNSNDDNINPNAFRHGYWNALMERRISKDYLEKVSVPPFPPFYVTVQYDFAKMFADAHEFGQTGLSSEMDYLNNALGRVHGATYSHLNDNDMALEMVKKIVNGQFFRIINNAIVGTDWKDLKEEVLFNFTSVSGGVSIDGLIGYIKGDFEIPSSINNKNVISIKNSAFENQKEMTKIIIPSSVTYIGVDAFKGCNNLAIYPKVDNKPNGWDKAWNSSNCPVVWGDVHYDNNYRTIEDSIHLSSYNYPSEYNNSVETGKYIQTEAGEQVSTNRLRTGVINYNGSSYLTMSAKNKDTKSAYLEYFFSHELTRVDYQLALWSGSESLILNSSIRLEGFYNNAWVPIEKFSAKNMSQNKDELVNYSTTFKEPTNAFRFIIETNQVYNDNNLGRMVIGDITVEKIDDVHVHSHDIYKPHSALYHAIHCECGDFIKLQHHTVSGSYIRNGHLYGVCIFCGTEVDLGTTPVIALGEKSNINSLDEAADEIEYYYVETSYINDAGILVLSPDDIEDFLDGLIFQDYC